MDLRPEVSPIDGVIHSDNIALLIACKTAGTYQQLQNAEPIFFPGGDNYSLMIDGPRASRTTIVWNVAAGELLIVCNGIDVNYTQVPAILVSWAGGADGNFSDNVFRDAANVIIGNLPTSPRLWNRITIIGHSFGGAVAHWLGRLLPVLLQPTTGGLYIYTYGAPKEDSSNEGYTQSQVFYRRVATEKDPVPALPPGPADMGSVWMISGVPTARAYERWRHLWGAYKVQFDGTMIVAQQPSPVRDPGLVFTLTSWATGGYCFGSADHSLSAYQGYFSLTPVATRATTLPAARFIPAGLPILSRVELEVARDTAVGTAATTVAASPEAAAVGIMTGVPRVPGLRFYGSRFGGKPYVFYNGLPILPTSTLRVRRAVVRRLNATLPF